ncbi:MAG TPA: ACT domain-containing protein [Acidimicrobiales bacterium]|nr:ACT domain-containing protein [Acidimicrobiales bacterium]
MPHFAVSAVGADRPGIVAAVTGALVDLGCNLEDTSMSILRGHFAMMLVVNAPDGTTADDVDRAVEGPASDLELVVAVRGIDDAVPDSPTGQPWGVSVYGADRPGIVHRVTRLLAEQGVNVVDLATRVIGGPDRPVYVMLLDVTLPTGVAGNAVAAELERLGTELGVDCTMHPNEPDIL